MRAKGHRRAFTITELVLVASGIGMLATFVLPAARQLQQRHRSASCLENLGRLGAASLAYATEDARHQLVPIHAADVTYLHAREWPSGWGWSTAAPHVFGGQTPTVPFPVDDLEVTVMLDEHWGGAPNPWGAPTRSLNPFVQSGGGGLLTFQCPADTGYPAQAAEFTERAIPPSAAGISCFEMLGNSYYRNHCGVCWGCGTYIPGKMSTGALGHAPEQVFEASRTVLYSDPLFYVLVRQLASGWPTDPICGWHGSLMSDNVAYCDGSARWTETGALYEFSAQGLRDMFLCSDYFSDPGPLLRRGPTWQMDCYPAPGALFKTYYDTGSHICLWDPETISHSRGWPYDRISENKNPYGPALDQGPASAPLAPEDQKGKRMSQ